MPRNDKRHATRNESPMTSDCADSVMDDKCWVHLEGMLDRDQRTARGGLAISRNPRSFHATHRNASSPDLPALVTLGQSAELRTGFTERRHTGHRRTRADGCGCRIRRRGYDAFQRFKEAVVIGVYLLSVIQLPRSSGAPTSRHHMDGGGGSRMDSHPKWINPCGTHEEDVAAHDLGPMVVTDSELLTQIVQQAKIALSQADRFKEDYVRRTFNTDYQQNHEHWKTNNNEWFPKRDKIPKGLGEKTSNSHLESLQLDATLLDMFEYLQTVAVGLEQVVWNQEDENGPFQSDFKMAEFKLRVLLCEIQMAALERGLRTPRDVQRDAMPDSERHVASMSFRNIRDWLILRDYMNALEYVIEVFDYFHRNL